MRRPMPFFFLLALFAAPAPVLKAQDDFDAAFEELDSKDAADQPPEAAESAEPAPPGTTAGTDEARRARRQRPETATLVNMETSRRSAKLDELERRVLQLERDNRSIEDRLRNLDRSVDDLRRRH